ncbi:MAG: hypothetical protein ACXWYQ_12270, partial [Actinomycetota bacterium]
VPILVGGVRIAGSHWALGGKAVVPVWRSGDVLGADVPHRRHGDRQQDPHDPLGTRSRVSRAPIPLALVVPAGQQLADAAGMG